MTAEPAPTIADLLDSAERLVGVALLIECADGSSLSVVAGITHGSEPQDRDGPWTRVEVGSVTPIPRFGAHDESDRIHLYGRIPLAEVDAEIERRGGLVKVFDRNLPVTFGPVWPKP